jgi:asparagine synthase (glutamine-hydrolysing)
MSGIVGIYNLDGRPVEKVDIQRMLDSIAHRGPDGSGVWIKGPVALGCQLLRVTPESVRETQPLTFTSGTTVVFDGRLDNREELLASIENAREISKTSPAPVFVLAAYDSFGDKFAEHIIGDFALGLFDLNQQKLLLARDAIGVRPLYFCSTRKQFLFSSEIKALLAHPQVSTRPNDDYLAEFLFERLSGGDGNGLTFFEGIHSLPAGFMAVVTPERILKRQYWDFDVTRCVRFKSFEEYTEGFRHYFEQSVRRRLRSMYPVAVSVSGGLDSSSIFCQAETLRQRNPQLHPHVLGFSYISDDGLPSDEKSFLLEIERDYCVSIDQIPIATEGVMDERKEQVSHVEAPFLDIRLNIMDMLLKKVRQSGGRILLTGHWGDQMLFDQAYLIDLFNHLSWCKVWAHLREFRHWSPDVDLKYFRRFFFRNLLRSHMPNAFFPLLRKLKRKLVRDPLKHQWYSQAFQKLARLRTSKQTLMNLPFANLHTKSLYYEAKSRYTVLVMEWLNKVASVYGLEIGFPFLDQDLVSYLMAIPGEMQTWRGVPKGILREALRGVLPVQILERRGKADFTDLINDGVDHNYPQLVHCLQSGRMVIRYGYVDEEVIDTELIRLRGQIRRPDCLVSWSLSDLLGLETWLEVFFSETIAAKEVDAV